MDFEAAIGEISKQCVGMRVRRLNRVITALYEDALRAVGLKSSQLNILVVVGCIGEARPVQICEALQLEKSTLSRNIERMVRNHWLRAQPASDGRGQTYSLTERGKRLIVLALPAWREAQARALDAVGGEVLARIDRVGRSPSATPPAQEPD